MSHTIMSHTMPQTNRIFGRRFLELMDGAGFTSADIAENLNISQSYLSGVLHGRFNPAWLQEGIARMLRVDVYALFPDHQPEKEPVKKGTCRFLAPLNPEREV